MPIVLPDGSWGHYKQESDGDINKGADNLVAAAKTRTDQISKWDRLVASAFLQLDIAKGLTFKTIGSYNYFTKVMMDIPLIILVHLVRRTVRTVILSIRIRTRRLP